MSKTTIDIEDFRESWEAVMGSNFVASVKHKDKSRIDYVKLHERRKVLETRLKYMKSATSITPWRFKERERFRRELTIIYSMLAARRGRLHYQYLY